MGSRSYSFAETSSPFANTTPLSSFPPDGYRAARLSIRVAVILELTTKTTQRPSVNLS